MKDNDKIAAYIDLMAIRDKWVLDIGFRNQADGDSAFAYACSEGQIELPPNVKSVMNWGGRIALSAATIGRIRSKVRSKNLESLPRSGGRKKGKDLVSINSEMSQWLVGTICNHPQMSWQRVCRDMRSIFPNCPSDSVIRRWLCNWRSNNQSHYLREINPDKWKSHYMAAFGSYSEGIDAPNQLWEIDSSLSDVLLIGGRHAEIAVVDVYSRKAMVLITKSSRAEAIIMLLRDAIQEWGLPHKIKADRGRDYSSDRMIAFCAAIGVDFEQCRPYSPWQKPHVERFFKTFHHDIQPTLGGYIGHDVATREEIRSQKSYAQNLDKPDLKTEKGEITKQEFQMITSKWVRDYNDRVHSETKKTPNESFRELERPNFPDNPRLLDLLLRSEGQRKVLKNGISFDGFFYIAGELVIGDTVQVYGHESDLGILYIYSLDGEFLCEAVCPELVGVNRAEIAQKAKAFQKQQEAEARREIAAAKRISKKLRPMVELLKIEEGVLPENVIPFKAEEPKEKPPTTSPTERERSGEEVFNYIFGLFKDGGDAPILADSEIQRFKACWKHPTIKGRFEFQIAFGQATVLEKYQEIRRFERFLDEIFADSQEKTY